MHFDGWMLLFPVVLGIHNGEEYWGYDTFTRVYRIGLRTRLASRRVALASMILVTAAAIALAVLNYRYRTPALEFVSRTAVFALLANALGHCALSVLHRKPVAGTYSAVGLVLPFSATAIYGMHHLGDSIGAPARCAVIGALSIPVIILVSLAGGLACSHVASAFGPQPK